MTYGRILIAAETAGLIVMGALHVQTAQARGLELGTLILLGAGSRFWPAFSASQEARDGAPDPIDRWSTRVIGGIAAAHGAAAHFPFGGPPHAPFIDWALKSGRAFQSPIGMLVHDTVGLMISYRGALHLGEDLAIPLTNAASPCATCADRPCTNACPVAALSASALYDVERCHRFLDGPDGQSCMMGGCAARRACPVSRGAGRRPEQSALHMRSFHPS